MLNPHTQNSTLTYANQRVNLAVCHSSFPIFLPKFLHTQVLTSFIELEARMACIYSSRNGPHNCHGFHKGPLLLLDVHKASVIGNRVFGLVVAGFNLSKVKRKRIEYYPPPGEHQFKTVCRLMISKLRYL